MAGAGWSAYRQVLRRPAGPGVQLPPALVARLPLSMTGLGIVLLVSLTTGSFGRAGLVTGGRHPDRSASPHRCGAGRSTGSARPGCWSPRR